MLLRRNFLVRGELDASKVSAILSPVLLGVSKTTHKVKFRTSEGVVDFFSMSLGSGLGKYVDVGVSGTLRKIIIRNKGSVKVLEGMLRSGGIKMVEILSEGSRTVELKK